MEENIKEIMKDIEFKIEKLDIFTEWSKEAILLRGLAICREKINKITDSNSYGKELLDEIDTVDMIAHLSSKYAIGNRKLNSEYLLPREDSVDLKFRDFYDKIQGYSKIRNVYEIGREGHCVFDIKDKKVKVNFKSEHFVTDPQVDIQNIVTNIKNSDIREKKLINELNKEKNSLYACARKIINCTREIFLDDTMIIGKFSLDDFWKIEAAFLYICINDYILNGRHSILGLCEQEMIDEIMDITNIQEDTIISVLNYLTFNFCDSLSLMCTPLVKIGENYFLGTFFFTNANFERNLTAIMNIKNKDLIDNKQKEKEKSLLMKVCNIIKKYPTLSYGNNRKIKDSSGNILTDIDFVICDRENALIIETKNLLQPSLVSEHLNYIGRTEKKGMRKGLKQLRNLKNLLKQEKYVKEIFGDVNINNIEYLMITNGYIANIQDSEFNIMNILMFEELFNDCQGDLSLVFGYISNKKYLTTIEFIEDEIIIQLFDYMFYIPIYLIADSELNNL